MNDVANTATRDALGLVIAYHRGTMKDFGAILRPHVDDPAYHSELLMAFSGIILALAQELVGAKEGRDVETWLKGVALTFAETFSEDSD